MKVGKVVDQVVYLGDATFQLVRDFPPKPIEDDEDTDKTESVKEQSRDKINPVQEPT